MTIRWLLAVTVLAVVLGGCGPTGGPNGRFCDVARRLEASVDPVADAGVLADPAKLSRAMADRVDIYQALAMVAPSAAVDDAMRVRDGFVTINAALATAGYRADALDTDPALKAALSDGSFVAARTSLARDLIRTCGVGG